MDRRRLGSTDIEVTPVGLGCMQFAGAGGLVSRVYSALGQDEVTAVVRAALDGGIGWFDTAEMYGGSERALAAALRECGVAPGETVVATKWAPLGRTATNIGRTITARHDALRDYPIDLYQIHQPVGSLSSITKQVRAMAALRHAGAVRAVGVSNFTARQMRTAATVLADEGLTLAANQVQISLLRRKVERNGVLDTARELGVTLIAYSPLAGGVLTGRFHDDPEHAATVSMARRMMYRSGFGRDGIGRTRPLIEALRTVAADHGVTIAQVALNWLVSYYGETVVAIPGASRPAQATEAAGAMDFTLAPDESARIDELAKAAA